MIEQLKNTIVQGDCVVQLQQIPSQSIDVIFADPPYFMQTYGELLRVGGDKFAGVDDDWDKFESYQAYDEFCTDWPVQCQRVLKKRRHNLGHWFFSKYLSLGLHYAKFGILDLKRCDLA